MAKRKRSTAAAVPSHTPDAATAGLPRGVRQTQVPLPPNVAKHQELKPPRRQPSRAGGSTAAATTNPNANPDILDGASALRASPDAHDCAAAGSLKPPVGDVTTTEDALHPDADAQRGSASGGSAPVELTGGPSKRRRRAPTSETAAADLRVQPGSSKNKSKKGATQHVTVNGAASTASPAHAINGHVTHKSGDAAVKIEEDVGAVEDPEDDVPKDEIENEEEEVKEALRRPPPINSDILPLPWKGRLGYACLNTYLRSANPPVFSSRTCRIASILEHRHPLKDPSQPEHATKNRPDKDQPADVARGMKFVEELGLANARDIIKMLRWNDKYGIKFMRLSSEMFPFASHEEYGYKLAPFASETLAEVGKVVAELGHRVTTHPGQFTQLGSPRKEVITNAVRDLEFHEEMLSLLKLPPQQNRDAVMILHLGGAYGDKPAALDRFRQNYAKLPQAVKNRLVLENDDVVWSVHELLPICQELNIPFVLDFHHHNILFDSTQIREGTKDIVDLLPQILETWTRKGITPKMHYSEPCPNAVTGKDRRKHSPRVMTLPPCPDTMDLMIEAKDKEQAVFELMRTFKLPGFHLFNDIIPHVRQDENKPWKPKPKKAAKKGKKKKQDELDAMDEDLEQAEEEEKPPALIPEEEVAMGGPDNRVYWPPGMEEWLRPPKRVVKKKEEGAATPAKKKRKAATNDDASVNGEVNGTEDVKTPAKKPAPKRAASSTKKKVTKPVPTPSITDDNDDDGLSLALSDLGDDDEEPAPPAKKRAAAPAPTRKRSGRVSRVTYKEEDADDMNV